MNKTTPLYIGTSGLVLPYKNQNAYPPALEGYSRIAVYGTFFNSIEINSIFYKLPRQATIKQWAESVGPDFRFTFKLWKQITHIPGLDFNESDVEQFFDVIAGAEHKAGCVLIQFPPSVKPEKIRKVERLLSSIQMAGYKWPIAVEFRSSLWYTSKTYDLLNQYNAAMVYHDKSGSASPHIEMDSEYIYLRFHGPGGNYKGSYDDGLLYEYAGYISEWLQAEKQVYVYFNNTMGAALDNLLTLQKFIREVSEPD